MKLSCVLVSCNENTKYLDFWPVVKLAWWNLLNVPCIMIYVGNSLPLDLQSDSAVIFFKSIQGWPTATQAQCMRLLYPALLKCDGAVMISDMDIIPLQTDFFIKGFDQFNQNQFVSLRGIDEYEKQIYMCYVGATPKTWGEMFNISSESDIRNRLIEWSQLYPADGNHGGKGWCSDQLELYKRVKSWQETTPERVGLVPWTAQIPRLCRSNPMEWFYWNEVLEQKLKNREFVDFHMPPFQEFLSVIYRTLETCVGFE
jgi:hypothetical protein